MSKQHHFTLNINWTGNKGTGTSAYAAYGRNHTITAANKVDILASADAAFLGDNTKYNPEDMLVYSIASCHMLWYLHLCADAGIIVEKYEDKPTGILEQNDTGSGKFTNVTLNPNIQIANKDRQEQAILLHKLAHEKCFIANSCNFAIKCMPIIEIC